MKKTIALLLALGLLAGCTPQGQAPSASGDASASSAVTRYEQATLYLPNDNADGLVEESARIEVTDPDNKAGPAEDLVQALVSGGALPEGTEVRSVQLGKVEDGTETKLTVDLNAGFADGLRQRGTAGETMILASLVNTLWAYYEPSEIVLTVGGNPLETGHNIYEEPFTGPYTFD